MQNLSDKYIQGDCMDYLPDYPDDYFQLAIIDPPYGLGGVNFVSNQVKKIHKEKDWNKEIPSAEYFEQLVRVSKNQIIWGCNYYNNYIESKGRIVFDKCIPDHGMQNFSDCDLASHSFGNNIKLFRYEWRGNVQGGKINWKNEGADARIHPTQKPIALYKWLLKNYAKQGDLILDSHVGSASSLIAFIQEGFDFIGFEKDPDYYKESYQRVIQETSQTKLTDFCE